MNRLNWIIAAALAAGAAAPALADAPGEAKEKVIIMTERHQKDGAAPGGGDVGTHRTMVIADCGGDRTEATGDSDNGKARTKVVICTRGDGSSADRAKRLEHVLARINENDELSADAKARITTALREALARLNAAH